MSVLRASWRPATATAPPGSSRCPVTGKPIDRRDAQTLARHADRRATVHDDPGRGNLHCHTVHFLRA